MQASVYVLVFTTDDSTGEENILHISARMVIENFFLLC